MKQQFINYIYMNNRAGSNKASSYIKALEYLNYVLDGVDYFDKFKDIYKINDVEEVIRLYNYILKQQNLGTDGIFKEDFKKSYWQYKFYSAAINSYKQFLIIYHHEQKLNNILIQNANNDPHIISRLLQNEKIDNVDDFDMILTPKEGKSRVQTVSVRVNQYFFRKMILCNYKQQCCINGLNVPDVLRASHIVAWAEDKDNRLNPANGLCLSATYDAAFDRHLISLDDDYRLILGKSLREYTSNQAFKDHFKAYEGKTIILPDHYLPDKHFLKKHRDKLE